MYPFLQFFLLIFTTFLFHIGITNPNRSFTGDYVPDEGIGSAFATAYAPNLGKLITWIFALYQLLYLCLQAFYPSLISIFYPQISTFIDPLPLTTISILGYLMMIIGGLGRIWCYKTLGIFFTFEITIRNSHKLIKTGPYAYVRHPSYTFLCILIVGFLLVHQRLANFFPNNYLILILFGPIGILTNCMLVLLPLSRRIVREEQELSKTFGNEWTQYASMTKRFIPKLI